MWDESSKNCESNCQCSGFAFEDGALVEMMVSPACNALRRRTGMSRRVFPVSSGGMKFPEHQRGSSRRRRSVQGLITENFKINSGSSATKRKQETALAHNYKLKMNPHSLDFTSPIQTKRRILGELQNFKPSSPIIERLKNSPDLKSPGIVKNLKSPLQSFNKSPLNNFHSQNSPLTTQHNIRSPLTSLNLNSPIIPSHSPLTSRLKRSSKITRIFEERTRFKMSNKENLSLTNETYMKLDVEEETRDCSFADRFQVNRERVEQWSMSKLDFTDALPSKPFEDTKENLVPEEQDLEDLESLQDLEAEFENENFDQCTNYEIISTDSPNIISRGRSSTSGGRKISSRNFNFGAPIADSEQSTSFNGPAIRTLSFDDDDFEFTSPAVKKTVSVKKSLKFNEVPTKHPLRHERSDSSIGSMSSMSSPASTRFTRLFTSESTTSMESGFISELEEPFLEIEESNSPKIANFEQLLSGQIKETTASTFLKRPMLGRSLSFHPEPKARVSLLSILESPEKRKRSEKSEEEENISKRRRSNCESPIERLQRPVLQRAYSENNASIMSALARSAVEPDLIGDFSCSFALPLIRGDHSDLKSISCDTLAKLLRGHYRDTVANFQVIDCRYPYEFSGGHITDALNLYTPAHVHERFVAPPTPGATESAPGAPEPAPGASEPAPGASEPRPSVLIFHCEFSLQRGPKLSRYLRSADREKNKENYPSLDYPEVYLLHEGYRTFYQKHPDLCTPQGYTAMLDPQHKQALRRHRSVGQPATTMRKNRLLL